MPVSHQGESSAPLKGGLVVRPRLTEFVRRPFTSLFVSLVLLFALGSVTWGVFGQVLLGVLLSAVLVSGVWSVARSRRAFLLALLLATPTFLFRWALLVVPSYTIGIVYLVFAIAFYLLVTATVVVRVFSEQRVTMDTINGASCVYLFLGIIFAHIFSLAEVLHPGSFSMAEHLQEEIARTASEGIGILSYFSFVTLTTLGYGEITPVTSVTRSLASLEAIIGQLYLTILVARLVGLHVSAGPPAAKTDAP
jgi:hypothetical protein